MEVTRTFAMVALVALGLALVCFGADWPQFRGPLGSGISLETGINKDWAHRLPTELWRVPLTDEGYGGPAVADGRVFTMDHQGAEDIVRALDLATGQEIWRFAYPDADAPNYGFTRSTPTIAGGKVYTVSRLGKVHCLDAQTGVVVWSRDLVGDLGGLRPEWDYAASPVLDGQALIVCPGGPNGTVATLDRDTGETIWQGGGDDVPGYATPVVAEIQGVKQYVVFTGVSLIGLDAGSGQLLWRHPWETSYQVNAATPLVEGDRVFITSNYRRGCAMLQITPAGPQVLWENTELQAHFNSPVGFGGHIYGTTDPGDLVCLDPNTGAALWRQPGFEKGGLCLVDGVLIVLDGRGGDCVMVSATPDGYRELGRFRPLGGQSWVAPIVADGKLIVRNNQTLACFDLM
jgi:outer membrane protein assembly factor BamB